MQRHILDRPKTRSAQRLKEAVRLERAEQPHPSTLALQRRTTERTKGARLKAYAKLENSES